MIGVVPTGPARDERRRSRPRGRDPVGLPTPYAERVLDLVAAIPPGRVMAYGDIAVFLAQGGGPRQVGNVMSRWGDGVPWHRVVRADGRPAQCHEGEALARLRAEDTPLRGPGAGDRVDMARAGWHPPDTLRT